jgi:ribosomal protein S18 acetylase RimI-like enzyme
MTEVTIRPAIQDDASDLTAYIDAAYAPFFTQGLTLPPVSEGIAEDIANSHVWVAESAGRIVGGIVLVLTNKAHLPNLAVHPDAGGQGVGRRLIDQAQDAAIKVGHDRLHLATHIDMTATQAFYRRLGWQETGQEGNKVYFAKEL